MIALYAQLLNENGIRHRKLIKLPVVDIVAGGALELFVGNVCPQEEKQRICDPN